MNDTLLTNAREILRDVVYSTIATSSEDGTPWAAPMFTVYDPDTKAVYWCAPRNSQHAQNIRHNGKAFITTYDSMASPGEGSGVYLRAIASEVADTKVIEEAHAKLIAKHQAPYWSLDDLRPSSPVALYRAKVKDAWVNQDKQEDGHFVLYRQSIEL